MFSPFCFVGYFYDNKTTRRSAVAESSQHTGLSHVPHTNCLVLLKPSKAGTLITPWRRSLQTNGIAKPGHTLTAGGTTIGTEASHFPKPELLTPKHNRHLLLPVFVYAERTW